MIIYRIAIAVALYASGEEVIQSRASLIASATAACINLLTIVILNFVSTYIYFFFMCLKSVSNQCAFDVTVISENPEVHPIISLW